MLESTTTRVNHQYSPSPATPVKSAYLLKPREMASANPTPGLVGGTAVPEYYAGICVI